MPVYAQLHETTKLEEVEARRCKARLEHLVSIGLPQKDEATKWNDKRMDRILADYMLRRGYHRSATQLARERNIEVSSTWPHWAPLCIIQRGQHCLFQSQTSNVDACAAPNMSQVKTCSSLPRSIVMPCC